MQPEIAVTTSSFGAAAVREQGQAAWIALIAAAGASHVEIREELFTDTPDFVALGRTIASAGLGCVYSVPLELWPSPTAPLNDRLATVLIQARQLGADTLKVSLGHFTMPTSLQPLAHCLKSAGPRLLVENDQTPHGGSIESLLQFFDAVIRADLPIGMTFDVGNWQWLDEDSLQAARFFANRVEYLHCKAVRRRQDGLHAVAPACQDLRFWQRLAESFTPGIRRAIEFPLQGRDLQGEVRRQVDALRTFHFPAMETRHV